MITKRNRIHGLEMKIERLEASAKREQQGTERAYSSVAGIERFLDNLLELDPSLDRFRRDGEAWGLKARTWDIEGVKTAVEFRRQKALADRYFESERRDDAVRMGKVVSK